MLGKIISPEQSKNEGKWLRDESSQQETTFAFWPMTIVVLEDGLTNSYNRNLRMTLVTSIEDVDELLRRCGG
jgi:hypothetical protein